MEIYVNSRKVDVKHNNISDFVIYSSSCESEKKAEIRIILDEEVRKARVRPQSVGITPILKGKEITFDADIPCKLDLEFPDSERLPPSVISGFQADESLVENVRFVNLSVHGQMIKNLIECRMVCERAKNISFEIK